MHPDRVRSLNSVGKKDGAVLYWMNRELRVQDNWSLIYAQQLALESKAPLIVVYNLCPGFLGGGERQQVFKIEALQSVEKQLHELNIPFFLLCGAETEKDLVHFIAEHAIGAVVTDFFPLRLPRAWIEYVRKNVTIPLYGVDAHNIVPCWVASEKQEFGAYTIRPKLHRLLPQFLDDFIPVISHPFSSEKPSVSIDWQSLLDDPAIDRSIPAVDWIHGDHETARQFLMKFLHDKLPHYALGRNDPNNDLQSDLSPFLHYGVLSAQRAALATVRLVGAPIDEILSREKNKAKVDLDRPMTLIDNAGAFLEELIVRRELSDNFCFYNPHYDSTEGFPAWAKKSYDQHRTDPREYLYTLEQFEQSQTHDPLWNAAQSEMVQTGKMHGYMRMYWVKKILEWTKSPEEALQIAITLNDRYELDGRDPNGYAGIMWSIGGVHDRAWFERPVFGQIRYMNANGCKSKFDTGRYVGRWSY